MARAARRKYVLCRAIRLTGHSRGGSMADYVGRELGLPSLQINPGSWGKLFREEQVPSGDPSSRLRTHLRAHLRADLRPQPAPPPFAPALAPSLPYSVV